MKILQLSSADTLGGGERHFADLVNALAARDHKVHALLRPASPVRERLKLPAPCVSALPLCNALDVRSAAALARLIREREIEIVHAHLARDYPLASLALRRARNGAALVITRHVPFPMSPLHRLLLRNVARVIAVSEGVARGLRAEGIFPADKIRVVPNGLDVEGLDETLRRYDLREFRRRFAADGELLVGIVGELSQVKGQEDFLRAAAAVVRRGTGNARFLVVGEDRARDGATRKRLESFIAAHELESRVTFAGRIAELTPLLASLDVYVSASRAEAFGLATAEAMMHGVAVVATATDGAREMIEDGVTGRLVPVGDVEALAGAISELLTDGSERWRLGDNARQAARARYGLARMVDATEQIYRELLD